MTDETKEKTEDKKDLPVLKVQEAMKKFSIALHKSFEENNLDILKATSKELVTRDEDNKKLTVDQCFRDYLTKNVSTAAEIQLDIKRVEKFFLFALQAARESLSHPSTPILTLADVFDFLPLSSCEILFKTVEDEVATWRSAAFYASVRNHLLRLCNDLLRRLSRTQNTVFCGRILLFLARFFPFSERSGLNVISEFNLENITSYSKEPLVKAREEKKPEEACEAKGGESVEEKEKEKEKMEIDSADKTEEEGQSEEKNEEEKKDESEVMEIELVVEEKEKLDAEEKAEEDSRAEREDREFKLYSKFWQLQDFFRCPTQCYQKDQWETFCSHTTEIIQTFSKRKLESRASKVEVERDPAVTFMEQYFAKYLTNQNLLALQLNDSNFRRYILVQYLIIFQYLQSSVKFKTEQQVLEIEQTKFIDETRKKIYKLLEETPPNGKAFAASVKAILKREQIWIGWKNDGCASFVMTPKAKPEENSAEKPKSRKRRAPLGELMKRDAKVGRINLGNKGLTKLWNLNPDNLEACKEEDRNFLPSLEAFFEDAIMEIDPKNQVEDSYKKVNSGEWGWRALRLMSRRSQHFFLLGNSQISKLPEYLEMMMGKMASDFGKPISKAPVVEMEVDTKETSKDATNGENGDSNGDTTMSGKLTEEQLVTLSIKLADKWKALIPKLGLPTEQVEELEGRKEKGESNEEICLKLLSAWAEQEQEGASPDEISYILGALKLSELIAGVF